MANSIAEVLIIGAGPAGLTAGYILSKSDCPVVILEQDERYVGGISRTVSYKGFLFDIGGHRFFSKSKEIEDLWDEILPNDIIERPRSSRIYYKGKFFSYPLRAFDALINLGPLESLRCVVSYALARARPIPSPKNFQDWVTNQFGRRLFEIFFKTYTEKVWGMDCRDISADWAAQRIKGLSLGGAIKSALFPKRKSADKTKIVKTLIDKFRYPRKGPGMMWEAAARKIRDNGGTVELGCRVEKLSHDSARQSWTASYRDAAGAQRTITARHVISSAPMREIVESIEPAPACVAAARQLKYRDFLVVALIVKGEGKFDDNWIYIHDPSVSVGRVQNFKSWSPEMIPTPGFACYGMEYFCFEGDGLWSASDDELLKLGAKELTALGLVDESDIVDGCVVRQPKAYPVYDDAYAGNVEIVRTEIEDRYKNFHFVGRNGMHKYNNQDHAMMTAWLTAKNILLGTRAYDVWGVNQDAEYHETVTEGETSASGLRLVPSAVPAQ